MSPAGTYFERVEWSERPSINSFEDRTVFQSDGWIEFIREAQGAEPVAAVLISRGELVGQFTGLIIRRLHLKILGSPFPGWTTAYMGFNLLPEFPRQEALTALLKFSRKELRCVHVEFMDRRYHEADATAAGCAHRSFRSFEVDLSGDEDAVFGRLAPSCRRNVRKAAREGVRIETAADIGFADDYYNQLEKVFARQGLRPTYSVERVRLLMKHLLPTGRLLLLRAHDSDGVCIATGIFPADHRYMYFWGGASLAGRLIVRPNEAIQWFAMKYWKSRGVLHYDMGGGGEYKRKYGGRRITVPWMRKSHYPGLGALRALAKRVAAFKQHRLG